MAKVFMARIRKVSDNALGITIPKEIADANKLMEDTLYWFELRGRVKTPEDD